MANRFIEKLKERCPRCRLRPTLCLCAEFPRLNLKRTCLRLVIHRLEGNTTTNTGLLACEVLPGSQVLWRGHEGEGWIAREALVPEGHTPLLLFPEPGAEVVDENWLRERLSKNPEEKFSLIVPDGSWRQARRVGRREPALAGMTHVTLPPGPPSEYRLRREPHPHFVCTFEAIARLLGVLESEAHQRELEALFRKFVGRQLWARGALLADQVPGGIPEVAVEERQKSGFPRLSE